ncbi:MAG: hypothetical protein LBC40_03130, partial [Dysgonamonadaceae bacterium]|nr:hypothetical protein [Dysgonamonadaceae bacterium]
MNRILLFLCIMASMSAYAQPRTEFLIDENLLDKRQWLYFGWEEDHPKAVSLMGGAVYPRRPKQPAGDNDGWKYSKDPWHQNSSDIVLFLLSV